MRSMKKYSIENSIGNGNFSTVYKAKNIMTNELCAIKIMKTHQKIALREAQILKKLKHPNIISLLDFEQNEHESLIVLEQAGINTLELYQSHKNGLREEQVKCILFQTALGLAYVHSFGIIHRDVKPENILIDKKIASVKIIDFGLAVEESGVNTDYIATRWYRAPENLLGTKEYCCAIDVFSLGCVMVELYLGGPLFPGLNNLDQLIKIFNVLGYPSMSNWPIGYSKMLQLGLKPGSSKRDELNLNEILKPCDPKLISIIMRMLEINPKDRITCNEILKHEYFRNIRQIIPPTVYSRYEQDYLPKRQLNFKNTHSQKYFKLNLNLKPSTFPSNSSNPPNPSFGKHKQTSSLHRHSHISHENQKANKSISIDSTKSYNSYKEQPIFSKKQSEGRESFELRKNNSAKELLETSITSERERKFGFINEGMKTLQENFDMKPGFDNILGIQKSMPFSQLENQDSKLENLASPKQKILQNILPTIPNVPLVKLQNNHEFLRDEKSLRKEQLKINRSPGIMRSYQSPPPNINRPNPMQNFINFSVRPSLEENRNNPSPQILRMNTSINFDQNQEPARRNRLTHINMNNNDFKTPFSPQGHVLPVNFYRNSQNMNLRRPEQSYRTNCSPTVHQFHSPPPNLLLRKNTYVQGNNEKQRFKSPENSYFSRQIPQRSIPSGLNANFQRGFGQMPYEYKK